MPGPLKDFALVRLALSKLDLKTSFTPTLFSKTRQSRNMKERDEPICNMFDLPAHLENVFFRLNHVRTRHEKKWLRTLEWVVNK